MDVVQSAAQPSARKKTKKKSKVDTQIQSDGFEREVALFKALDTERKGALRARGNHRQFAK